MGCASVGSVNHFGDEVYGVYLGRITSFTRSAGVTGRHEMRTPPRHLLLPLVYQVVWVYLTLNLFFFLYGRSEIDHHSLSSFCHLIGDVPFKSYVNSGP
jgi:hypothetical protein